MKYLTPFAILLFTISITIVISLTTLYAQSIRLDEAQSIWVYTKSVPAFLKITAQDVLVPLYGLLLHFWLQIFGTSIIAARSLSLLFFIFTVPILSILAKESANKATAYLTVLLFAVSPFIVWYSNEARMYRLFLFTTTLNHFYFLRLYNTDGKSGKLGLFFSTVLGLYSHYFFLFLILTQITFIMSKMLGIIQGTEDFNYKPTVSALNATKKLLLYTAGNYSSLFCVLRHGCGTFLLLVQLLIRSLLFLLRQVLISCNQSSIFFSGIKIKICKVSLYPSGRS